MVRNMSRGLGSIERFILDQVSKVDENGKKRVVLERGTLLARDYYMPEDVRNQWESWRWEPSNAQRKAMTRALHSFVRKFPEYGLMGGNGRKTLILYERAD